MYLFRRALQVAANVEKESHVVRASLFSGALHTCSTCISYWRAMQDAAIAGKESHEVRVALFSGGHYMPAVRVSPNWRALHGSAFDLTEPRAISVSLF